MVSDTALKFCAGHQDVDLEKSREEDLDGKIDLSFLEDKSITISFQIFTYDLFEEMAKFLIPRVERLVYIRHPFPSVRALGDDVRSTATVYEEGKKTGTMKFPAPRGPSVFTWIKDVMATFTFLYRLRGKQDVFFGVNKLNTLIGLALRRLGRVDKVVFYAIDYMPDMCKGRVMHKIHESAELYCCYHADCLWNVTPMIMEERARRGVNLERCAPAITVPWANRPDMLEPLPLDKIDRRKIIYAGMLLKEKGAQLAIESLPDILADIPGASLEIIGGGSYEPALKQVVENLQLGDSVVFLGPIGDQNMVERRLGQAAIGLATYVPAWDNYSYHADPGKIKLYMGCGLPVITTEVARMAKEIADKPAGCFIAYEKDDFVSAAKRLMTDDEFYALCRKNALKMSESYSWPQVLKSAFSESRQYIFPYDPGEAV